MRVYFDVCCLNRPFDDQRQERVRLESEAILLLLQRANIGQIRWVSSEVVDYEVSLAPDAARRGRVLAVARRAQERLLVNIADGERASQLEALGFGSMDALHLSCAERAAVEVFITTDDGLLRVARRESKQLGLAVQNPIHFLLELELQ